MARRPGGQSPDSYGLSHTVYIPTASETNPVEANAPLVFATTGANHAVPAPDGAAIQLIPKQRVTDPYSSVGVWVLGFSRIHKMRFTGAPPAIGSSVVSNGAGGVRTAVDGTGAPIANGSFVLYVNAELGYVEVAFP